VIFKDWIMKICTKLSFSFSTPVQLHPLFFTLSHSLKGRGLEMKKLISSNPDYVISLGAITGCNSSLRRRKNQARTFSFSQNHRNQTINRKGAYVISRRPSHGQFVRRCCPQAFLRIFSEVTYIRTEGNSTLLKIYTLPNHTITIGVCIYFRDTTPWLIIWWWR
jgi:hypothetical protein